MSTPQQPGDSWAWPSNEQARGDLAQLLEEAAKALRDGRATVHRSATSTTSGGPSRLDVDLEWSPPGA
ncbi:hypothetical protein EV383_5515 [Pseudonocardia sediminis]|uniref:Uncharacterized protein n=1 Tax=Pseudonocardia sediminis TaxID=1397368 RepID=A0A4Q7V201_PSEST|nr:hypothetical protein [Pseudonocardia sediminis]RZT88572.1 hypothetical protein EV383_5515 [Pseudonocardia sediminis]